MSNSYQTTPVQAGSLARLLNQHTFFRAADSDTFIKAQQRAALLSGEASQVILSEGESSPFAWFLVDGSVTLQQAGQPDRELHASDPDAGYPPTTP